MGIWLGDAMVFTNSKHKMGRSNYSPIHGIATHHLLEFYPRPRSIGRTCTYQTLNPAIWRYKNSDGLIELHQVGDLAILSGMPAFLYVLVLLSCLG
jgi:hypothetical protein